MNKAELLAAVRAERAAWEALLAQADQDRMTEAGPSGEWSVKDLVAHVTWHEREMLGLLEARVLAGSELWNLPTHERNAVIYRENRDRPLDEVLAEARQVYPQLVAALEALPEAAFGDPAQFRDMPADWEPWRIIADNTCDHYRNHLADLRARVAWPPA